MIDWDVKKGVLVRRGEGHPDRAWQGLDKCWAEIEMIIFLASLQFLDLRNLRIVLIHLC
jgi:hypothetical protein